MAPLIARIRPLKLNIGPVLQQAIEPLPAWRCWIEVSPGSKVDGGHKHMDIGGVQAVMPHREVHHSLRRQAAGHGLEQAIQHLVELFVGW